MMLRPPAVRLLAATLLATAVIAFGPVSPVVGSIKGPLRSVVFLIPRSNDARWEQDALIFTRRLETLIPAVSWVVLNAHNRESTQIEQARQAVDGGAGVLVVSPVNSTLAAPLVTYAHSHGVEVIAYDRPIEASRLSLYVGYSPVQIGKLQGEYVLGLRDGLGHVRRGNLIIINGPYNDDVAQSQFRGLYHDTLAPAVKAKRFRLVPIVWTTSWSARVSHDDTIHSVFYAQKRIAAIVDQSDTLAAGSIQALSEVKPPLRTILTGAGGTLTGLRAVLEGEQTMTVFEPGSREATAAADATVSLLRHKPLPPEFGRTFQMTAGPVRSALFQPIAVTSKTIESKLVRAGFLARSTGKGPMNVPNLCAGLVHACRLAHIK